MKTFQDPQKLRHSYNQTVKMSTDHTSGHLEKHYAHHK